jgi:hypothetical protein
MPLAPLRNRSVRQQALTLALAVAALGTAWQARAQATNVSRLVMGTQQTPPAETLPTANCQGCSYVTVHAAGATTGYSAEPGPYLANTWPPAYGASFNRPGPASEVLDIGTPPVGYTADGGSIGALRRARTQFDGALSASAVRELAVQTWRTGSGRVVASHAIRITPTGPTALATYLEFTKPQDLRSLSNYASDTLSNYSVVYTQPERFQASTTVDVTVDGLPVWTSSRLALLPRDYAHTSTFDRVDLNWGETLGSSSTDRVTLFLGMLPPGETRQVNVVLRSDLRVEVRSWADCMQDSAPLPPAAWRCHSQREGLTQPGTFVSSAVGVRPAIRVFTR